MTNPTGRLRITWMETLYQAFVDMIETVHFRFGENDLGYFIFGAVEGQVDYRVSDNEKRIEFSWSGNDDGKVKSGRGRLEFIYPGTAKGHFFIHC